MCKRFQKQSRTIQILKGVSFGHLGFRATYYVILLQIKRRTKNKRENEMKWNKTEMGAQAIILFWIVSFRFVSFLYLILFVRLLDDCLFLETAALFSPLLCSILVRIYIIIFGWDFAFIAFYTVFDCPIHSKRFDNNFGSIYLLLSLFICILFH